jgi:CelD/BcsL family acetyltransferase involved in cellulose biosynthesis
VTQSTSQCTTELDHFVFDPPDEKTVNMPAEGPLKIGMQLRPVHGLSREEWNQWDSFRTENRNLASPFFSREFIETAGKLRPTSQIAVLYQGDRLAGFLPFEYARNGQAIPLAGPFNDAHGVIGPMQHGIRYSELSNLADLPSMRFHAWDGNLEGAEPYILGYTNSYLADLTRYPEGYVTFLERERATIFKQQRKTKKMVRDLGPLRLDFDCRSELVLGQLLAMKRSHYQRTNIFDILSVPWAQQLLRDLWSQRSNACRGVLNALYAGDTLVAAHFGLREGKWLHYWFPTYDPEFHQYSPGTALFLEIARQSKELGISQIDMGYGEQPYKLKLTDTIRSMPFGILSNSRWPRWRERTHRGITRWLKRVPFKEEIKKTVRSYWPDLGRGHYE